MKTALLIVGVLLVLCFVSFLLVTPEFILNPYYHARYQGSHLSAKIDPSPNPSIFEKFGPADSGGSYNYGSQVSFFYASHHNSLTQTYYYRFGNTGKNSLCATSEGFAYLLGNVKINLAPEETKYFILQKKGAPRQSSYRLHFYESCGLFSNHGGSLELTLPVE